MQVSIIEQCGHCGQCAPWCIQLDVIQFQTCKWRQPWLAGFSCSQGLVYWAVVWIVVHSVAIWSEQSPGSQWYGCRGTWTLLISSSWCLSLSKNWENWGNHCSCYFCKLWSCWRGNPCGGGRVRVHREKRLRSSQQHFMKQMLFSLWVDKGIPKAWLRKCVRL